jgi:diguanylate cyclase (GGDEF)-like protein/PAS domain S-box-containing protein
MSPTQPLHTLGLLVPYLGGIYYSTIITSAYETARRHSARLVVIKESPRRVALSRLGWDHVDGWIVVRDTDGVELMTEAGAVVVTLSTRVAGLPAVLPDNHGGVRATVSHLIAHGHRRIAFLGNLENADVAQRFAGYRATLAAHGLPFDEHLVVLTEDELLQDGARAAQRLLASGVDFTAIVAATDMNALGVMEVLQAAGWRLPEDCAVVGFDDILMAQTIEPALTTVQQHFPQIASLAVERLLAQLADPSLPPDAIYVPTALVVRHSCGCRTGQTQALRGRDTASGAMAAREPLAKQLLDRLAPLQSQDTPLERTPFWISLGTLLETIDRAIANRALPGAVELQAAWREIMALGTDVQVLNDIITTIEQTGRHLLGVKPLDDPAVVRLTDAMWHLRRALLQAHAAREHDRIHHLDRMLYTNNDVSIAMLDTWTGNTASLEWLQHTSVAWGCLGLWADATTRSELTLVSTYLRGVPSPPSLDGPVGLAAFPPIEALAAATPADDELIMLIPLRTARRDWGVLALNAVIDSGVAWYSDPVGMWSHLLSVVLERVALLNDLEVQQRGLLQMYQHEQLLTATLRASEERYALAATGTNDGLWDWDVHTGQVYYSPRWKALLGYHEHEIGASTQDWFGRVHPDDLHILQRVIAQHHASRNAHFEVELRMRHRDGEERWMLCRGTTVYDAQGDPQRVAGSIGDISQRKHFEEQLRHSAFHDALTGLPNRSLLLDRLDQAIQRARDAAGHQFALLFLDLDRFKTINDSLGHLTGDLLLISVARRLQAAVRRSDTVARLGGDEFVILLDDIADRGEVASAVHQIEEALRAPFNLNGHEVFTSASIGILIETGPYEQPEALLRDTDLAMYQAKALGRGRHEVFSESLHIEARQRLQLETDLHRALERQELRVYYQPIVSLESRRIIGAEALLRWEHPARGLVSPLDFIPLAEETGLIEPIGRWVLQHACAQAQEWHRQGHSHLTVSVNVSIHELKSPRFAESVAATLQQTGLPPHFLILEMTESAYMEQASVTGAVVERLRAMGVQIAFDDFGTGYSSLSYLRHFRVNRIKIDRSFIRDMTKNATDLAITGAMIAMAHQLNINVVAEGVETEEHLELLGAHRCDTVQGYLISRPVPNDAFLELLEQPAMGVAPRRKGATAETLIRDANDSPAIPM